MSDPIYLYTSKYRANKTKTVWYFLIYNRTAREGFVCVCVHRARRDWHWCCMRWALLPLREGVPNAPNNRYPYFGVVFADHPPMLQRYVAKKQPTIYIFTQTTRIFYLNVTFLVFCHDQQTRV